MSNTESEMGVANFQIGLKIPIFGHDFVTTIIIGLIFFNNRKTKSISPFILKSPKSTITRSPLGLCITFP